MGLTKLILKFAAPLPNIENYQRYLFIGPHPDDIEIGAGATVAKLAASGKLFHSIKLLKFPIYFISTIILPKTTFVNRFSHRKRKQKEPKNTKKFSGFLLKMQGKSKTFFLFRSALYFIFPRSQEIGGFSALLPPDTHSFL